MADKKDALVIKHNNLVEASYRLTLSEQRLLLLAISQVRPKVPLGAQRTKVITAQDYMDMFKVDSKNAYKQIRVAVDSFWNRDIKTYDGRYRGYFRWLSSAVYDEKEGQAELRFTPEIAPYLSNLSQGDYTKYLLSSLSGATSSYAVRMYELLMRFRDKNERWILVKDLRKWFALEDKYPRYYDLKRRVIEPAIQDINDNTDLEVDWEEVKKGRQVVKLNFIFASEKQVSMFK